MLHRGKVRAEFTKFRHICMKDLLNIFVLLPALNPYVRAVKPGGDGVRVCAHVCAHVCVCHQKAVEEDVDEHSKAANDEVNEVVEELKVQHHGFVAPREGSSVPHETYQEDDFIAHLEEETGHVRSPEGSGTVEDFTVRPNAGISGSAPDARFLIHPSPVPPPGETWVSNDGLGFSQRLTTERTTGAAAWMKEQVGGGGGGGLATHLIQTNESLSFTQNENDT